jgi:hypothetical protein
MDAVEDLVVATQDGLYGSAEIAGVATAAAEEPHTDAS